MTQKQDVFTLLGGKVKIYRGTYNPTSDAVWLAAFCGSAKTVLDVGIGTGGISLCYLVHNPNAKITAIDISNQMLTECAKNVKLNGADIELINADIMTWRTSRTFDLVMTNPPYFKGTPAKHDAHHNADIGEWTKRCLKRVRPHGYFCTIVDANVMVEVLAVLSKSCGDIRIFPLFGAKSTAERVLIGAKLGSNGGTRLFSGLSMNDESVLRDGLTIDAKFSSVGLL